jgi:Bacteriocin-protection, YdeI or OmpD-Associated
MPRGGGGGTAVSPTLATAHVVRWSSPSGPGAIRSCHDERGDLAEDVAGALEASPAVGAFFDTLAQFYRKGYLRYIDATKRRPDLRAARIAEVTGLLASGIKERPRS